MTLSTYQKEGIWYLIIAAIFWTWLLSSIAKSCGSNSPDFTTAARMSTTSLSENNFVHAIYSDTPKVRYVYVITVDPSIWALSMDTIRMVLNDMGKQKSVDDAEVYRSAAYRQLNRIAAGMRIDSIVNKPKK